MAKSGIRHADVGDELSKTEWLNEETHELIHGNSFPATPAERQLFYRDDEHKWYIYNGTAWKSLEAGATDHLDDIGDVNVPSPSDNDVLYWDNAAGEWKCKANWVAAHKTSHENGGSDEISLAGLSGDPADTINKSLLTTAGDIIKRGASAPERLPIGSNDQVLTVVAGAPAWAAASGGGGTKIEDADADTKVDVEESADEDKIRMDVKGVEAFLLHDDGILDLAKQSACSVYRNATQSIPNATWTKCQLNTENVDIQSEFDSVTNYRFTPKKAGLYFIAGQVGWSANTTGKRIQKLMKNAASVTYSEHETAIPGNSVFAAGTIPCLLQLTPTDYIELFCYQTSGAALNTLANYVSLHIVKVA